MAAQQRRDSVFLTLAPETSKSFNPSGADTTSRASSFSSEKAAAEAAAAIHRSAESAEALAVTEKTSRSDSVSSASSARRRFLKLNPVRHNVDAKESDFVEVDD